MSNINNIYSRIDRLPEGYSVVRGSDKILMLIWAVSLAASFSVLLSGISGGMWLLVLPFSAAGAASLILAKRALRVAAGAAACVAAWFAADTLACPAIFFLALYVFLGLNGTSAIIDSLQRYMFFPVLARIRYVNIREDPPLVDRVIAFLFNIPEDIDTRNIDADLDASSHSLCMRDIAGNILLSAAVCLVLWIVFAVWPLGMCDAGLGSAEWMLVTAATLYAPLFTIPFTVFRSMDVCISSSFGMFRPFDGFAAALRYSAVPLICVLAAALVHDAATGCWADALACIASSALALCISVVAVTAILFYQLEASSAYAMANKWKMFMPVPLLMGIREKDGGDDSFPGTPERDESVVPGKGTDQ